MADWLFVPAQMVVCRRNKRLLMRVDEQPYSENNATEYYVCTPAEEHAAGHGRGRSTRWWREDDLIAA